MSHLCSSGEVAAFHVRRMALDWQRSAHMPPLPLCSQEGVPETIDLVKAAGIRLWVLTGDKTETAVDIARSCRPPRACLTG